MWKAHHLKPVESLSPDSKTRMDDLELLCSNCHRMIHVARPWLTIEQLMGILVS
ncbi:MAG: HNH endonuclease [Syntrophobacteraceae bacterium]